MPSELQLHPVKLKHKLEYKSQYMYDMICKYHVMSATTWLKQHNMHYRDIKLNSGVLISLLHNYHSISMTVIIVSQLMRM